MSELESAKVKEKENLPSRTYGCVKCGSPIFTYPPDDVHNVSSKERESFLEAVESTYTCSKCNEVTRLYWGRPVLYRGIVVLLRRAFSGVIGMVGSMPIKRGGAGEKSEDEGADELPIETASPEEIEDQIYNYIVENGGSISVNRASNELGIPADQIKEILERMTLDGRLKQ